MGHWLRSEDELELPPVLEFVSLSKKLSSYFGLGLCIRSDLRENEVEKRRRRLGSIYGITRVRLKERARRDRRNYIS